MYPARDRIEHEAWLDRIGNGAARLGLGDEARANAVDLFLSDVPENDRSKPAAAAASLYAGALLAGEQRSHSAVARAMDVSLPSLQHRWIARLPDPGLDGPDW